jgi:hypothetical protein
MTSISMPSVTARKRAVKSKEEIVLGEEAKLAHKTYVAPAAPGRQPETYKVYDRFMDELVSKNKVNQWAMNGAILLTAVESVAFGDVYIKAARKLGWRYNDDRRTILFNAVNRLINHKLLIVVDEDLLVTAPTAQTLIYINSFIKFKSKKK